MRRHIQKVCDFLSVGVVGQIAGGGEQMFSNCVRSVTIRFEPGKLGKVN